MSELRNLVLDTLYGRRIGPRGSCFRSNEAGLDLAGCASDVLGVIESIIKETIVPEIAGNAAPEGLNYVLGAYLVIGVREKRDQVFSFLEDQPVGILREATACCSTFFYRTLSGYNFGVAPNAALLQFLRRVESTSEGSLSQLAREVRHELQEQMAE